MDQLHSIDVKCDEDVQALLLLSQLPDSWDNIVTSISASYSKNLMKLVEVCEMIMTEEIRRMNLGASSLGLALNMNSKGRNKNYGDGQRDKSKSRHRRSKSKDPNNNKKDVEC